MLNKFNSQSSFLNSWLYLLKHPTISIFFAFFIAANSDQNVEIFSGVYKPNLSRGVEIYAGAWLAPVKMFQDLQPRLDDPLTVSLEAASFFIVDQNCRKMFYMNATSPEVCETLKLSKTLMTRDYFDFQVEHLSSTTKYLEKVNFELILPNLRRRSNILHQYSFERIFEERLNNYTVAIIPISVNPIEPHTNPEIFRLGARIRFHYFKSTFWSIYRHIPRIVLSYNNKVAKGWITKSFGRYVWKTIDLSAFADKPLLQPKMTLQHISKQLTSDPDFKDIRYIYYSEADQILHLRHSTEILDIIDASDGRFVFSPHRMETYLLPQSLLPAERKRLTTYDFFNSSSIRYHAKTELIVSTAPVAELGSCCDSGRVVGFFGECVNTGVDRWMKCPEEGLRNVSTWLQFTPYGFAVPTITEHQGLCNYSATRRLCPVPLNCDRRQPVGSDLQTVCVEVLAADRRITSPELYAYLLKTAMPPVSLPL